MSADQTTANLPVISDDGFECEPEARLIQGTLLKCIDGVWKDRDGQPPPSKPLLVTGTLTAAQRWHEQKPIETIVKEPGKPLPDIDGLNAAVPKEEWETGLDGNLREPWQIQRFVYLWDEATGEKFTHANSTVGTRIAVSELRDAVATMRQVRGVNVFPRVTLDKRPMKAKHGIKLRPHFQVVSWCEPFGGNASQIAGPKEVPPLTTEEVVQDKVPY